MKLTVFRSVLHFAAVSNRDPPSIAPTGEWKARFDPRFTSRGVFYLDEQHMVDVEVMEDAKHPLSFFIDHELEAQVKHKYFQTSNV